MNGNVLGQTALDWFQEVYSIFASLRPRAFAFVFSNLTQRRKDAKAVNTSLTLMQKISVCGVT